MMAVRNLYESGADLPQRQRRGQSDDGDDRHQEQQDEKQGKQEEGHYS